MPARGVKQPQRFDLAIVGSSAQTRDLRQALVERRFPYAEVRLLGAPDGEAELTEFDGEPRLVGRANAESLAGVQLAFFCGDPATGGDYRGWPERGGYLAIDLTEGAGAVEDLPLAHAGLLSPLTPRRGWIAAAHPITHLLVSFLAPLDSRFRLAGVRGVVLRPAGDFGKPGIDELYQQSVSLLSFSAVPRTVFERQLAFNLLAGESPGPSRGLGPFVSAQTAALLGRPELPVSVFLCVAPVFHAHTAALHLEFESRPTEGALHELLRAAGDVQVSPEPLTAVEVAGESRPQVALLRTDPEQRSAWMWAVADQVPAVAAQGAVRLAERLLGVEPRPQGPGRRADARGGAQA